MYTMCVCVCVCVCVKNWVLHEDSAVYWLNSFIFRRGWERPAGSRRHQWQHLRHFRQLDTGIWPIRQHECGKIHSGFYRHPWKDWTSVRNWVCYRRLFHTFNSFAPKWNNGSFTYCTLDHSIFLIRGFFYQFVVKLFYSHFQTVQTLIRGLL